MKSTPRKTALLVVAAAGLFSAGALALLLKGSDRGSARGESSRSALVSPLSAGGERAAAAGEDGAPKDGLASGRAPGDRGRTVVEGDGDGTLLVLGADEALDVLSGREPEVWSGRVVEAQSGRAVSGASVALHHPAHTARSATDEDGRFELAWYEDLPAELIVTHAAYVDVRAPRADLDDRDDLVLVRSATVVGSLSPLPAGFDPAIAEVHLWLADRRTRTGQELSARFDADGRFRLGDLDPGHYNLAAYVPGETIAVELGLLLESGAARELVLRPSRGAVLEGRVLERDTDKPVAEAELLARFERLEIPRRAADAYRRSASTDLEGRYRIEGLAPGRWRMEIALPWGGVARGGFDVAESGARIEEDFRVPGPARAAGSVVAGGAGVPGARVYGLLGRDLSGLRRLLRDGALEGAPAASADERGRFRIEGLPSQERLVLVAFDDRLVPGMLEVPPISPAEEVSGLLLELPPARELSGRVADTKGSAVAGAELELRLALGPGREVSWRRTTSEAGGEYSFEGVLPGLTVLLVEADGHVPARETFEVGSGAEDLRGMDIALEPSGTLAGEVLDEDGFGVVGVQVRVRLDPESAEALALGEAVKWQRFVRHSDAYGRFAVHGLMPGPWEVDVRSADWEQVDVDPRLPRLPDDGHVTLTVRRLARAERAAVVGRVHATDGGALGGLRFEGVGRALVQVDGGEFSIAGLEPGPVRLRVRAEGYVPRPLSVVEVQPGERYDYGSIGLEPGTRVAVHVTDQDGEPVAKALVDLRPVPEHAGGLGEGGRRMRLEPGGKGVYRQDGVPRAWWRLRVRRQGFQTHSRVVEVRARARQTLNVRLQPAKGAGGDG